jgi:hypothetical protein
MTTHAVLFGGLIMMTIHFDSDEASRWSLMLPDIFFLVPSKSLYFFRWEYLVCTYFFLVFVIITPPWIIGLLLESVIFCGCLSLFLCVIISRFYLHMIEINDLQSLASASIEYWERHWELNRESVRPWLMDILAGRPIDHGPALCYCNECAYAWLNPPLHQGERREQINW